MQKQHGIWNRNFFFEILFLFGGYRRFIQRGSPIHADSRFLDFQVGAGTYFYVQSAIFVHFVNGAMNTGNGNDLITLIQILNKFFLVLGPLGLWTNKEKPEYQDHQSKENKLESAKTW